LLDLDQDDYVKAAARFACSTVLPESKFIIGTGGSVVTRVIGTYPFGFSAISILNGTARIFRPAGLSVF